MKKILIFCVLINLVGCNYEIKNNEDYINLKLNIKNSTLKKTFLGNEYHKLKGFKDKINDTIYKFVNIDGILRVEVKNDFLSIYKSGILLDDTLTLYLHDLSEINSKPINIEFNPYSKKSCYFFPDININNLELNKNRTSNIYKLKNENELTVYFSALGESFKHPKFLKDIIIDKRSLINLRNLKNAGLYPKNLSSFFIVENPLTKYYSILPDFDDFGTLENNISEYLTLNCNFSENKVDEQSYSEKLHFSGKINVDNKLIYKNKILIFERGCHINFSENSCLLIENCEVKFNGSVSENINITGPIQSSLYIKYSKVYANFLNLRGLSNLESFGYVLPSAVTFYDCDVEINNSVFEGNYKGDDLINFYNSNFKISHSTFQNSFADAIDSDFSNGIINDCKLINIGNDALDFSGSNVQINKTSFSGIDDKAISAGENSDIKLNNSNIKKSELGIVVKDGTTLNSANNKIFQTRIDYAVFGKKDFYKLPILYVDFLNTDYKCLFQTNSIVKTNNKYKIQYLNEVESLLYGNIYGKASK